jgi:hypothetical protein
VDIDLEIVMNYNIPESHDFPPRDLRMGVSEFERNTLGHFTEHSTLK